MWVLLCRYWASFRSWFERARAVDDSCSLKYLFWGHSPPGKHIKTAFNPFTPKGDQVQISPVASPVILHHTVWRTWLFIAYSDWKMILVPVLTTSLIHFSWKGWENVLFELGIERVKMIEEVYIINVWSRFVVSAFPGNFLSSFAVCIGFSPGWENRSYILSQLDPSSSPQEAGFPPGVILEVRMYVDKGSISRTEIWSPIEFNCHLRQATMVSSH